MEEEVKYTSEFDGQTTDEVLKHAKSVKDLTIPSLSNISGFVCIDNEGKAIGMMSKEQVAQVVGGLIGLANKDNDGLAYKGWNPTRVYSNRVQYLKIATIRPFEGTTIYITTQSAGQNLLYSHYKVQLAGGNNSGIKGNAHLHKEYDNISKKFFLLKGNNTDSILFCSSMDYEFIGIIKPLEAGTIIAEFVDSIPEDAEQLSPL